MSLKTENSRRVAKSRPVCMGLYSKNKCARCISFGPYFNNGNQNPFCIELTKTDNYYRQCLGNQASFTFEIYRMGEDAACTQHANAKKWEVNGKQHMVGLYIARML